MSVALSPRQILESCTTENTPIFSLQGPSICKVLEVLDGDTFRAAMALGEKIYVFRFRVFEINAPELKPRLKATDRLQIIRKARAARVMLDGLIKGKICELVMHGMDNFGRVLAEVSVNSVNVGHVMLESGNAIPFYPTQHRHNQTAVPEKSSDKKITNIANPTAITLSLVEAETQ